MVKHKLLLYWICLLILYPIIVTIIAPIFQLYKFPIIISNIFTILSFLVIPVAIVDYQIVKRSKNKLKREWKPEDDLKKKELEVQRVGDEKDQGLRKKAEELEEKELFLKRKERELDELEGKPLKKGTNRTSKEIIEKNINVTPILEIFDRIKSLDQLLPQLNQFNLSSITEDFMQKVDQFDWVEKDKINFIIEMLSFTPKERMEILNDMLEKSNIKSI